jgi:hypothetical protein
MEADSPLHLHRKLQQRHIQQTKDLILRRIHKKKQERNEGSIFNFLPWKLLITNKVSGKPSISEPSGGYLVCKVSPIGTKIAFENRG